MTKQVVGLAGSQVLAQDCWPHTLQAGTSNALTAGLAQRARGRGTRAEGRGAGGLAPERVSRWKQGQSRCVCAVLSLLLAVSPLSRSQPSPGLQDSPTQLPLPTASLVRQARPANWEVSPFSWPGAPQLPTRHHPSSSRPLNPHTHAGLPAQPGTQETVGQAQPQCPHMLDECAEGKAVKDTQGSLSF